MKSYKYIPVQLMMILLLSSCRKENVFDCFTGSGKQVTELRQPGIFSSIMVFDKIDVDILQGSEYKVEVTAGDNIIKKITTTISENVLRIDNRNTCNFVRGYKKAISVAITIPYLSRITNNGVGPVHIHAPFEQDTIIVRSESSGDVYLNGKFNEVRTSSHGNGDIYLQGASNSLFVYAYGTNFVFAENFTLHNYAFIHTLSYGDCIINADSLSKLDYNIQRDGNIYYRGQPGTINDYSNGEGRGRAIKLD